MLYCANFDVKPKEYEKHLEKKLAELYELAKQSEYFVIEAKDNRYLERQFKGEMAAFRARGEGDRADYSERNKESVLERMARHYSEVHHEEYKYLAAWFLQMEYPKEVVALLLHETLSKIYEKDIIDGEEKTYVRKREQGKSIANHMSLNCTTVPEIIANVQGAQRFADVYFEALEVLIAQCRSGNGLTLEGVNTFGMGKWLKFDSWHSNQQEFHSNVQKLKALVVNTPWCTAYLAGSQLMCGDFYVFVDNGNEETRIDPQPHIAVRLDGSSIGEVRGILEGQEIENEYLPIAEDFLVNNSSILGGRYWLEDMQLNKRYIAYSHAILQGIFEIENLQEMIDDLGKYTRQYGENSNKARLRLDLPFLKPLLADHFKVPVEHIDLDEMEKHSGRWIKAFDARHEVLAENEKVTGGQFNESHVWQLVKTMGAAVSFGDCNTALTEARKTLMESLQGVKREIARYFRVSRREVLFGDLDLADRKTYGTHIVFGNVTDSREKRIQGDMARYIRLYERETIEHFARKRHPSKTLKYVVGNVNLEHGLTTSFPLLTFCFGDFNVIGNKFQDALNLREVHGRLSLDGAKISLSPLKTVKGGVFVNRSFVRNLGGLENVEGPVEFVKSQVLNLFNLITLPGSLSVINTLMPHNLRLKEVGGDIFVRGNLDVPSLMRVRRIAAFGGLTISPLLEAEVIRFHYKDYSVAEYLALRKKAKRKKEAEPEPEPLTLIGLIAKMFKAFVAWIGRIIFGETASR